MQDLHDKYYPKKKTGLTPVHDIIGWEEAVKRRNGQQAVKYSVTFDSNTNLMARMTASIDSSPLDEEERHMSYVNLMVNYRSIGVAYESMEFHHLDPAILVDEIEQFAVTMREACVEALQEALHEYGTDEEEEFAA